MGEGGINGDEVIPLLLASYVLIIGKALKGGKT